MLIYVFCTRWNCSASSACQNKKKSHFTFAARTKQVNQQRIDQKNLV